MKEFPPVRRLFKPFTSPCLTLEQASSWWSSSFHTIRAVSFLGYPWRRVDSISSNENSHTNASNPPTRCQTQTGLAWISLISILRLLSKYQTCSGPSIVVVACGLRITTVPDIPARKVWLWFLQHFPLLIVPFIVYRCSFPFDVLTTIFLKVFFCSFELFSLLLFILLLSQQPSRMSSFDFNKSFQSLQGSVSGLGAQFSPFAKRTQQLIQETLGNAEDKTQLPEEYLELERKVEALKTVHQKLLFVT